MTTAPATDAGRQPPATAAFEPADHQRGWVAIGVVIAIAVAYALWPGPPPSTPGRHRVALSGRLGHLVDYGLIVTGPAGG